MASASSGSTCGRVRLQQLLQRVQLGRVLRWWRRRRRGNRGRGGVGGSRCPGPGAYRALRGTRHHAARTILAERYELGRVLGEGGMARVYRATDGQLGRPVAVKVLAPPVRPRRGYVERFQARGLARRDPQPPEHRHGLRQRRGRRACSSSSWSSSRARPSARASAATGPMEPGRAIEIGTEVCHALAEPRTEPWRDPPRRETRQRDARRGRPGEGPGLRDRPRLRRRGRHEERARRWGAPPTCRPSRLGASPADERSRRVRASAACLYQMVTGRPPFIADDARRRALSARERAGAPPRRRSRAVARVRWSAVVVTRPTEAARIPRAATRPGERTSDAPPPSTDRTPCG